MQSQGVLCLESRCHSVESKHGELVSHEASRVRREGPVMIAFFHISHHIFTFHTGG